MSCESWIEFQEELHVIKNGDVIKNTLVSL